MQMIAILILILGAALYAPHAEGRPGPTNWSGWRGPEGTGISAETNLPEEWSSTKNIKWKTAIPGRGHSSPIVWDKKIFLTTDIEGEVVPGAHAVKHNYGGEEDFRHPDAVGADRHHHMKVLCVNRDTGKVLWEVSAYQGTVYDDHHRKGGYASPTPVTDGKNVFAWFGTEGLYCYDFDGKLIWKVSPGPMGELGMGPGGSPVMFDNLIILQIDEETGKSSFVIAYDKKTGRQVWKTARKVHEGWSSPLVFRGPKGFELITSGNGSINSYDPATGKELWSVAGEPVNPVPTPVAGHGMAFVTVGNPVKHTFAFRLGGKGELVWQYDKGAAYVSSSILYGDYLYITSDRGILTCLEAESGKVVYEGGRVPVPASFSASPVAFDGKILLTSEDGDTFIVKAGPRHEVIGTNSLGEPIYASPAISDGMIFIRGENNLYCIASRKVN
jgi:outer membrane protein assembly factor BamB